MAAKNTCCETMKYHLEFKCDIHKDRFLCADAILYKSGKTKKIGIIIHDGGSSYIEIEFCPWCGKKII